jgi:uncharacterized protein (TIGR00251 family)
MALVIEVKVVPSSGKQQWVVDKTGKLKCYLKSPPERGKANDELIKSLAKAVGLPYNGITIIAGATGRAKLIKIERALTLDQLLSLLGIEKQLSIG